MADQVKLVHFTDVHLLDRNPPSRLGDYKRDVLSKLQRIGEIGKDVGAAAFTCGGDWFHEKPPAKTSHSMVHELLSILKEWPAQCYTILGNHDIRYDRSSTITEQPLGVLLNSGAIRYNDDVVLHAGNHGVSVRMAGFEFAEEPPLEDLALNAVQKAKATYHVLSLHVYASLAGGTLWGKTKCFSYKELLTLGYDVILLGHYHADQGVVALTRDDGSTCHFVNIGSLSRGDYGDENLSRVPKCCLVSFGPQGITTEEIVVGAKPAAEVFDLVEKEETKAKEKQAAEFVEKLRSSEVATSISEDPVKALESLSIDDSEVLARTKGFLLQATALLRR